MNTRTRRGAVAAAVIAVAWMLAGCSSDSADEASYGGTVDSGGDAAFAEEAQADMATEDRAVGEAPDADRSVVVTGALYMTVEDPIAAADDVVDTVQGAGGRIDARSEIAPDEYDGGSAWLTLRIPSDRLDPVVDDLRELGTVDEYSTNSFDVTREVTDLESQISTLRASTGRIEALLVQAEDIEDIITLENELDNRQAELESLEARQRGLDDQVSMSTIELSLTTEPVVIVDDEPDSFLSGLQAGWEALVAFFTGALIVLGVLLPWIAVMGLIALGIIVAVRARRHRTTHPAAAAPERDAAPAATHQD